MKARIEIFDGLLNPMTVDDFESLKEPHGIKGEIVIEINVSNNAVNENSENGEHFVLQEILWV